MGIYGLFIACETEGEFTVSVRDQTSGAIAAAKVSKPLTTISYGLPFESKVKVEIFNILGQRVETITNQVESAGLHSTLRNSKHLASGIYIIRINAISINNSVNFTKAIKIILMK